MLKARHLENGGTIGVISPASPSETRSEIPRACEYLESMGYKVVIGKNVNKAHGFVAASEQERADDFNEMFRRDDIDAIFVTQGGYGSAQIIHLLDFESVKANPKIFTGFSDITSLHLAIMKFAGLITFHSPGMARFNHEHLMPYTKTQFFKAITSTEPLGDIKLASEKKWLYRMAPGVAEGEITGGNLTLVCATMGTPYEIETKGKILFLEEVDTEPWIIDHSLSHLWNAGKLQEVAGVVIGECKGCVPRKHDPGYNCDISLEEVLEYYLAYLGVPVLYGLPLGHTGNMATLPLGAKARLDADKKQLTILESGVL